MARLPSKQNMHPVQPLQPSANHQNQGNKMAAADNADPQAKTPVKKIARKKNLPDTPPRVINDTRRGVEYQLSRSLGEGGFARCFLVTNQDGETYAAKTVAKKSLQSNKMRQKFFGEISVHKSMDHPNIVKFKECFEDKSNIYMILELCSNKSLMETIRKRKQLTESEARFYIVQILGAVKYMHSRNVIHRDLKLGNIFLDDNMNLKIGDFGLAALLLDGTERKKTICGTPNYIAPEVLFGKEDGHSFEVDMWSVGIILYAMLVGRPPFQSGDVDQIYSRIKLSTYTYPESMENSISSEAKSLISQLLNPIPANRPTADQAFEHPFITSGYCPLQIPVSSLTSIPEWEYELYRQSKTSHVLEVAKRAGAGEGNEAGKDKGEVLEVLPVIDSDDSQDKIEAKAPGIGKVIVAPAIVKPSTKPNAKEKARILPEQLSPKVNKSRMLPAKRMPSSLGPFRDQNPLDSLKDNKATESGPRRAPQLTSKTEIQNARQTEKENDDCQVHDLHTKGFGHVDTMAPSSKMVKPRLPSVFSSTSSQENEVRPTIKSSTLGRLRSSNQVPTASSVFNTAGKQELPPAMRRASTYPSRSSSNSKTIISLSTDLVLDSVKMTEASIDAFLKNKLNDLPIQPAESRSAVRRAGVNKLPQGRIDPATPTWLCKWVDYSNKAGMGYILNDGSQGTLFKDHTSIVTAPKDKSGTAEDGIEFVTPSNLMKKKLSSKEIHELNQSSLNKKIDMHARFGEYMKRNLGETPTKEDVKKSGKPDGDRQFVTHYARLDTAIVFRFENGGFQFNFPDHSKIMLHHGGRTVLFLDNARVVHTISLEEAYSYCQNPQISTLGAAMVKNDFTNKLTTIRSILQSWASEMQNKTLERGWLNEKTRFSDGSKVLVSMGDVGA